MLSKPFLTELEAKSALLVTSAFHMQRSLAVFEKAMPEIKWIPYGTDIQTVQRAPSVIEWLPAVERFVKARLTCANALVFGSMAGATICN